MRIIGLTGGIASGKSTVSRMLESLGCIIIDADIIARKVVEPGTTVLKKIVQQFGDSILKKDGTLNRKALGNIVFNDTAKLKVLNDITHPEIKKMILKEIDKIRKEKNDSIVVVDAAVLIESGMDELVDEVWLVYVDYPTQLRRLMKRDFITEAQAHARIKSQMTLEEKIKRSDKIIDNTKDIEFTRQQVNKILNSITH